MSYYGFWIALAIIVGNFVAMGIVIGGKCGRTKH